MRILLLADIHYRDPWYSWLAGQQSELTVIAGDLLDCFRPGGLLPQMIGVSSWCAKFPGNLALCSGNHDGNEPGGSIDPEGLADLPQEQHDAVAQMLMAKHWMDCLERPGLVTDGRSSILETPQGAVVVTTIPYSYWLRGNEVADELWRAGQRLRISSRSPWIVLHHEPPADTAVGGPMGDPELFYKVREYCPDFVVSGHLHAQPYKGSFADKIGRTWCFNSGCPEPTVALKSKIPNYIALDLSARTATWHAIANAGRSPIIKKIRLT